jgi:hypothetical protein
MAERQKPFLHTDNEHGRPLLALRAVNGRQGHGGFAGAGRDVAFSQVEISEPRRDVWSRGLVRERAKLLEVQ